MGTWGGVCEFDHRRYVEVVVPGYEGLADVMAHFDAELSDCDLPHDFTCPLLFEWVVTREVVVSFANLVPEAEPGSLPRDREQRFWTVLNRAVDHGNGLLWGRDLAVFYEPRDPRIFGDDRTPPVEIPYPHTGQG